MPKLTKIKRHIPKETDAAFFLKLVLYIILGSQWIRIVDPALTKQIPIPIGLLAGLLLTRRESFKIDRKIEYAILLISMLVGFWSLNGLYIATLK